MTFTCFIDLIIFVATLLLTIGFYTKKCDWLLIYWGCAPSGKRSKMPEDTIHDVAWIMTALCSAFMMLATMTDWYLMKTAAKWFKCGAITVFIVMIIVTFILSIKTTKHK